MLKTRGESIRGKTCLVSGSGNVAQYTVENINRLGGRVVTLSDSGGFIYDKDGIGPDKIDWVKQLKNVRRGRICGICGTFWLRLLRRPTSLGSRGRTMRFSQCDTKRNRPGGCQTPDRQRRVRRVRGCKHADRTGRRQAFRPMRASCTVPARPPTPVAWPPVVWKCRKTRATQRWTREEVDQRLLSIMVNIHRNCRETAEAYGTPGNYVNGANIAGFLKVARAMLDQGVV